MAGRTADETVRIIGRMLEAERAGAKFPAPHEPGFDVCETVQLGAYAGMPLFEVIGMDGDSRMQVVVREDGTLEETTKPVLPDESGRDDELMPALTDLGPWPGGMGAAASVREGDPVDDALRILAEYVTLPYPGRRLVGGAGSPERVRADARNRAMMERVLLAGSRTTGPDQWRHKVYGDTLMLLRHDEAVLALWHTIHPAAAPDGPRPTELNEWRQAITNAIRTASELASDEEPPPDAERREAAGEPRVGAREGCVPGDEGAGS